MAKSRLISINVARRNRIPLDWDTFEPTAPREPGIHVFDDYPLLELVDYIDWSPFFHAWELRGRYPEILDDPIVGEPAGALHADALTMLDRIISEGLLSARGVVGLFPAHGVGDDVEVLATNDDWLTLYGLRQQFAKKDGRPNACLSDFIAPKDSGLADHMGAFVVTTGLGLDQLCASLEEEHDDYGSIMAKALADRLAEAFAERLHLCVRRELWGHEMGDVQSNTDLISENYSGIRPAPGYPACPDHTEKRTLFTLLDAERHTGVSLTESCAMLPGASVSGWYFAHPEAHYFGVGRIGKDQVADYAERKKISMTEAERWLRPNLGYEPEEESP
jgi:5-methyltetrahydrofolate--homocysteine methyltransferase